MKHGKEKNKKKNIYLKMKRKEEPGQIIKKKQEKEKNVRQTKESEQVLYISFFKDN
jgi:hypothetical protein